MKVKTTVSVLLESVTLTLPRAHANVLLKILRNVSGDCMAGSARHLTTEIQDALRGAGITVPRSMSGVDIGSINLGSATAEDFS